MLHQEDFSKKSAATLFELIEKYNGEIQTSRRIPQSYKDSADKSLATAESILDTSSEIGRMTPAMHSALVGLAYGLYKWKTFGIKVRAADDPNPLRRCFARKSSRQVGR